MRPGGVSVMFTARTQTHVPLLPLTLYSSKKEKNTERASLSIENREPRSLSKIEGPIYPPQL
jgi:hypothetical protein